MSQNLDKLIAMLPLPAANLATPLVARHPLKLA